jgi:hypothetical protein
MIVQAAGDRTVPARFLLALKYRNGKYQHGKHE